MHLKCRLWNGGHFVNEANMIYVQIKPLNEINKNINYFTCISLWTDILRKSVDDI